MQKIGDKTIIRLVYENVQSLNLFDEVLVVTDNDNIVEEIQSIGGSVKKVLVNINLEAIELQKQ